MNKRMNEGMNELINEYKKQLIQRQMNKIAKSQ